LIPHSYSVADLQRYRQLSRCEELGYRPHLAARSLRQTKSRHIGVAFAPVGAAEADLVEAIYPAAAEHCYQLVLSARTGTGAPSRRWTSCSATAARRIDRGALLLAYG
jgi:DNA-binding LacI/PurR family transcriptional regulator